MIKRRVAVLVAVLSVAAFPGIADASSASPSPGIICRIGDMTASSPATGPTSIAAGQPIVDEVAITNVTSTTLTDGSAIVAIIPPAGVNSGAGTPYLAWRYDGGPWHQIGLSWATPAGSGPSWQGPSFVFGATWAPGATHMLELETKFTTSSPNGEYQYEIAGGGDPCSRQVLFLANAFSEYGQGWKPPTHAPVVTHSTSARAPVSRTTVNTHTSSATSPTAPANSAGSSPATPSPSAASPSASVAPSPSETLAVAVAQNVSDEHSGGSASLWIALAIAFGVLVFLAAAALVRHQSRRRQE